LALGRRALVPLGGLHLAGLPGVGAFGEDGGPLVRFAGLAEEPRQVRFLVLRERDWHIHRQAALEIEPHRVFRHRLFPPQHAYRLPSSDAPVYHARQPCYPPSPTMIKYLGSKRTLVPRIV